MKEVLDTQFTKKHLYAMIQVTPHHFRERNNA